MKLDAKLKIRGLELQNRIVMAPMATGKAKDGIVGDDLIDYYAKRAQESSCGLIITEHSYISDIGRANPNQLSVACDRDIEQIRKIAEGIHQSGNTKVFVQINHAGGKAKPVNESDTPLSPSALIWKDGQKLPKEMSEEEIDQTIRDFVSAALRVKEAGFDGVEIHGAHGYLLCQFYSPLSNHRKDLYGGRLENRMRMPIRVLKAVREAVGEDFPISYRLGGMDYRQGGSTLVDCVAAAKLLEENGADIISVSGGHNGYVIEGQNEAGYFKQMSLAIKKEVSIPVILTGGINNGKEAEALLEEGAADLIGVGRAMLKDPDWSLKALKEVTE